MSRVICGFRAGLIAGIIKNILDLVAYQGFKFQANRYIDHVSAVFYDHKPQSIFEALFSFSVDIWFTAFWGVIFFYLIESFRDNNYLFLGWLYGSFLWFLIHVTGALLRIDTFYGMTLKTLFLHLVTDSIYGIVLGYFYSQFKNSIRS